MDSAFEQSARNATPCLQIGLLKEFADESDIELHFSIFIWDSWERDSNDTKGKVLLCLRWVRCLDV